MKPWLLPYQNYRFKSNEKPASIFLLKLLILLLLLKLIFYFYNAPVMGNQAHVTSKNIIPLLKWSLGYDALVLLLINTGYFILLTALSFFKKKRWAVLLLSGLFLLINFFCVLLNLVDVFYFHFHLQRADADLLYVLQHPFEKSFLQNPGSAIVASIVAIGLFYLLCLCYRKLLKRYYEGRQFIFTSFILLTCCILFFATSKKKIIPTYPLTELNSSELQLVQNSFHSFLYSVYRKDEAIVHVYDYLPPSTVNTLMKISGKACGGSNGLSKRNIVLFIMESIPEDFFNASGKYKVKMPFLDSIVSRSTYFSNAYSYGHSSNKGITAILTGLPTLTEIPLYHSNYANIKMSPVGSKLELQGYSSSFFIGDSYDDFGFAKVCNWLGIQKYYSKEDIPGHEKMGSHTMGLHDEYVLNFMNNKVNEMKQPFFAINYNTSTHYPNDLPKNYKEKYPQQNFSQQMKCMSYYNECLQAFFRKAQTQAWYNNTVFIFCSDHWMYPDTKSLAADMVQSFHIPLFVFDPANPAERIVNTPASQFDILNTILCLGGSNDSVISYGHNLLNLPNINRVVFSKENNNLYQAIDSSNVLGFNPITGKPEFCYNYRSDLKRNTNLALQPNTIVDSLTIKMKAFLQKASYHYNKK